MKMLKLILPVSDDFLSVEEVSKTSSSSSSIAIESRLAEELLFANGFAFGL
jgi:hypothetical protein